MDVPVFRAAPLDLLDLRHVLRVKRYTKNISTIIARRAANPKVYGRNKYCYPDRIEAEGHDQLLPWQRHVPALVIGERALSTDHRTPQLSGVRLRQPPLSADSAIRHRVLNPRFPLLKLQDVFDEAVGELSYRGSL